MIRYTIMIALLSTLFVACSQKEGVTFSGEIQLSGGKII